MANFTPADVVAAYQEQGLRADVGYANLILSEDDTVVHDPTASKCCAIGALAAAARIQCRSGFILATVLDHFDVSRGFVEGFDHGPRGCGTSDDFRLGVACREAVEAAGLFGEESDRG